MMMCSRIGYVAFTCLILMKSALAVNYDVVIRNGNILDGTGSSAYNADIAINKDTIVKIGHIEEHGTTEIDASGQYVTPGWIDIMDQTSVAMDNIATAPNKIYMGVTSVISGEAGTPVAAEQLDDYLNTVQAKGLAINFGTFYSATQARVAVMGDSATTASDKQIAQMATKVNKAMDAGAFGITTALVYPPAAYHRTEDLIALSKVVAARGGIYATHLRDESANFLSAVQEAISIGENSHIPVEIFHLKAAYEPNWGADMTKAIQLITDARKRGIDIAADMYPYTAAGTGLEVTTQLWLFKEGIAAGLKALKDETVRQKLKQQIIEGAKGHWTNYVNASGGWQNIVLAKAYVDKFTKFEGMDFATIGHKLHRDPADVAWDIMIAAFPKRPFALYFMISEADLQQAIVQPWVSFGTDAASTMVMGQPDGLNLPHPRSYGTFPRVIARYVRELGILSLPDAIHKMTLLPAQRLKLNDRGVIAKGKKADITIFDYKNIKDLATWEKPFEQPQGINFVLVNGIPVLANGQLTKQQPGIVLRSLAYKKSIKTIGK